MKSVAVRQGNFAHDFPSFSVGIDGESKRNHLGRVAKTSLQRVGFSSSKGGAYDERYRMQGGSVTGGGFREYGLKVRPGTVPKDFTSDPVIGE